MRTSLDALKAAKTGTKTKAALLQALDAQALSIVRWLPTAKIPSEYLLLRAEDAASRTSARFACCWLLALLQGKSVKG